MLFNVGEYVVCGQYVADYSTTECRMFQPKGLRQPRKKLSFSKRSSCIQLLNNLLRFAHKTMYSPTFLDLVHTGIKNHADTVWFSIWLSCE